MANEQPSRLKHYLRWLAVLPGAGISAVLVTFPIHWIIMRIKYTGREVDEDGTIVYDSFIAAIPPDVLEYFAYAFFTPFVIILVGAYIAPSFKFVTSITLALSLLVGYAVLFAVSGSEIAISGLRFIVTVALNVAGIAAGLYMVRRSVSSAVKA